MKKNNLFTRQMNTLCHKCVLAQPSCVDETQLELAAGWGHISSNPSFPLTIRSPRPAEPGAALLTPVLSVTKASCHQGQTRPERGTSTSPGHPAGLFAVQCSEVEQFCHPLGTGQSLSTLTQSRAGDSSQGEGDSIEPPDRSSIYHLFDVCTFPPALGSVSP